LAVIGSGSAKSTISGTVLRLFNAQIHGKMIFEQCGADRYELAGA
jgi:ABC-type oligopeptide transport system ATPase subunit